MGKVEDVVVFRGQRSVVQGMSLRTTQKVYYDGICIFWKMMKGWTLKEDLSCENGLFEGEIFEWQRKMYIRIKDVFEKELKNVSNHLRYRNRNLEESKRKILSKVSEMVEVNGEEGSFLVMKYQVTQVLGRV